MKKRLTFKEDKSDKFWHIETVGNSFTVSYGKTGTDGQTQTKTFGSEAECEKAAEKLVNEKLKKGYVESKGDSSASVTNNKAKKSEKKQPSKQTVSDIKKTDTSEISNSKPLIQMSGYQKKLANPAKQWYIRYENEKGDFIEAEYDVYEFILTTRSSKNGKIKENQKKSKYETIVCGIYDHDNVCGKALKLGMNRVIPPWINRESSKIVYSSIEKLNDIFPPTKEEIPVLVNTIEKAIENGADLNRALLQIITKRRVEKEIVFKLVKLLIDHGADVNIVQNSLTSANYPTLTPLLIALFKGYEIADYLKNVANLDFHMNLAIRYTFDNLGHYKMSTKDGPDRESYKESFTKGEEAIRQLVAWGCPLPKSYDKIKELLSQKNPIEQDIPILQNITNPKWFNEVEKRLKTYETSQIDYFIEKVLTQNNIVEHPEWSKVIDLIIQLQPSFKDIAEDVLGERVSLGDDEGTLTDGWFLGTYSNIDALLLMLKQEKIIAHTEWEKIIKTLIKKSNGGSGFDLNVDGMESFFEDDSVKKHPQRDALLNLFHSHYDD